MTKVITVNERGALTLPKSVRDLLGVTRGGQIVADTDENGVRLRPGVVMPVEIYSPERVEEFQLLNEAPLSDYKKIVWRKSR